MAEPSRIEVMISSRCEAKFPDDRSGRSLTEIREELKTEIENLKMAEEALFKVWISEQAPAAAITQDWWDRCLEKAKVCHILLVLSNGDAGTSLPGGQIGICHAEFMEGYSLSPGKVYVISIGDVPTDESETGLRNKRFQEAIGRARPFGKAPRSVDDLKALVHKTLRSALVELAQLGVRDTSRGKYYLGQALDWSRMDLRTRREAMKNVLRESILSRPGAFNSSDRLFFRIGGTRVLVVPDAIPAAMSVSAAKEMVGQPFLRDHELSPVLKGSQVGPIHIIACHKSATEAQALKMLGFPDATVVTAPFGVFVADSIQKVQFAFIVNCRDESTTRHGLQQFFKWLEQADEEKRVAARAKSRAKIVQAIAKEMGAE